MTTYAKRTSVPAIKTRLEIEQTVKRYGADQVAHAEDAERAMMQFRLTKPKPLVVRFTLPLKYTQQQWNGKAYEDYHGALTDQQLRQRWRALLLCIKAKLEAVETGIESVEHAFLAEIVLPNGQTMAESVAPQIRKLIEQGKMPTALLEFRE